MSRFTNKV